MVALGEICTKIGSGITSNRGSQVYLDTKVALVRSLNVNNFSSNMPGWYIWIINNNLGGIAIAC